ncbi:MAG: LptF/LptG family permease, partial [Pontibacterium sp.]
MNRLDWYIARHVLGSVIVVALVVVGLDLLFAFVDELPDFNQYYGLPEALWYVAQTAPRQAYEQIPLCTLIGCLIGLGSLA